SKVALRCAVFLVDFPRHHTLLCRFHICLEPQVVRNPNGTPLCRLVPKRLTMYAVFDVLFQGGTSLCRFDCLTGWSYVVCGSYSIFLSLFFMAKVQIVVFHQCSSYLALVMLLVHHE